MKTWSEYNSELVGAGLSKYHAYKIKDGDPRYHVVKEYGHYSVYKER